VTAVIYIYQKIIFIALSLLAPWRVNIYPGAGKIVTDAVINFSHSRVFI